jgi:hypothetical protein
MTESSTSVKELARSSDVAQPHNYTGGRPVPVPWRDIDNIAPAGSINSSVRDMARWMRFILADGKFDGRQLLKPETLGEITSPHTVLRIGPDTLNPSRHFLSYGLGIGLSDIHGVKLLQHTGGIDGMLSLVAMVPERRLGIVILTNVSGHNALYAALQNRILDAFLAPSAPARDWSAVMLAQTVKQEAAQAEQVRKLMAQQVPNTQPSRPLDQYAGTYRSEMYGDVTVSAEEGALHLKYGSAYDFVLKHFHYDTFLAGDRGALDDGEPTFIQFRLDPMAKVASVELPDIGEFKRVEAKK